MERAPRFLLQEVLLDPPRMAELDTRQCSSVISQGRVSRLLASLAHELGRSGVSPRLDARVRRHLDSALLVHEKQRHDLRYDCESLRRALASVGAKLVLLKGGAYLHSDLPVAHGRLITDIDIIVPRERLAAAEQALNACGWESVQLDPYDEHYYREWSHETPALVNRKRGTTLDLHHNILPPTAGPEVDASLLLQRVREVAPGVFTLSFQDMVIHSATHLFHEGEFHHGLRDIRDLDRMLRDFPQRDPRFWDGLIGRARELQLQDSLYHGLRYTRLVFDTPLPGDIGAAADAAVDGLRRAVLDRLFLRAFRPAHPDCRLPFTGLALGLLFIRSHYLRMPLYLLLPHLLKKARMRRAAARRQPPDANTQAQEARES